MITRNVIAKSKEDVEMLYFLGASLNSVKKYSEAINHLRSALRSDSRYEKAYEELGVALIKTKNYSGAEKQLKKGVSMFPSNAKLRMIMGTGYIGTKKYGNAVRELEKSIKLDPDQKDAYNYLGWLYGKQGDVEKAVEMYRKYINAGGKMKRVPRSLRDRI